MKPLKITIPAIPPSWNKFAGRKNHWEYRKTKEQWDWLVRSACGKKREPLEGKSKVTITYFFPTRHRRDPDNFSGKFILDGLVAAEILHTLDKSKDRRLGFLPDDVEITHWMPLPEPPKESQI